VLELTKEEKVYFKYLDKLRESGVTNMYGAAPYLEDSFGMDSKEARGVLVKWMETFGERHPKG
jgi:hypothetical protein